MAAISLRDRLSIVLGKASAGAIRCLGLGLASNLPGRLARRLSPHVLPALAGQARRGVIAVSGTNGKSTTAGFIYSILRSAGFKTVHNRQGANLVTGITATVVDSASWAGQMDADYCLFEIDEASLPVVAAAVPLSVVLVTNLFRDQLDRFGELDTTARLIDRGIAESHALAVLNADDPNVAQLACGSGRVYYGVESLGAGSELRPGAGELSYCPSCGSEYAYDRVFYGQLGHYRCPSCGSGRPAPSVSACDVVLSADCSHFVLNVGQESLNVTISLPGLFNVYNALAASAMARCLDVAAVTIKDGLQHYSTLFGRSERLSVRGKQVVIQLIKNPAGASQVVASCCGLEAARFLIAINDNLADGRDVSWLWDADFEPLARPARDFVVSGRRAYDMAVRLKYAGADKERIKVIPDISEAVEYSLARLSGAETLWILPTYTCLLELQKTFKAMNVALSGT